MQHPLDTFVVAQLGQAMTHAATLKDEFISLGSSHVALISSACPQSSEAVEAWVHHMDLRGCIIGLGALSET